MGDKSGIQWTDATWNPVTGCAKVSQGCANCYAETNAKRFWGERKFTDVQCHEDRLDQPLRWRKPRLVFVNSMSDLFHESVPDKFIAKVFAVVMNAPDHTFQILTKRPERMREWVDHFYRPGALWDAWIEMGHLAHADELRAGEQVWPLPNVWLGVSVEDQATADERIPRLLRTPAAVRFVSYEPALGPVNFERWTEPPDCHIPGDTTPQIDWLIVGGESGPGARPCNVVDIMCAVHQCREAGVPVFVKQLGAKPWIQEPNGDAYEYALKHSKGGDPAEWPEDIRVREFPEVAEADQ